jgi:hypothetical protein
MYVCVYVCASVMFSSWKDHLSWRGGLVCASVTPILCTCDVPCMYVCVCFCNVFEVKGSLSWREGFVCVSYCNPLNLWCARHDYPFSEVRGRSRDFGQESWLCCQEAEALWNLSWETVLWMIYLEAKLRTVDRWRAWSARPLVHENGSKNFHRLPMLLLDIVPGKPIISCQALTVTKAYLEFIQF